MIPVGCLVVTSQLLKKIGWLLGCCWVAVMGPQVFAMVSIGGFNIIPVCCNVVATWLLRKLSWLLGCC